MESPRLQSATEAGAYRLLREALLELRQAERTLTILEEAAPDVERALLLVAIRAAIVQLEVYVRPLPG